MQGLKPFAVIDASAPLGGSKAAANQSLSGEK